jgi:hypothetical protein
MNVAGALASTRFRLRGRGATFVEGTSDVVRRHRRLGDWELSNDREQPPPRVEAVDERFRRSELDTLNSLRQLGMRAQKPLSAAGWARQQVGPDCRSGAKLQRHAAPRITLGTRWSGRSATN